MKCQEGVRPQRFRQKNLVARQVDGELLLFDTETNTAHCLNDIAADLWLACERNHIAADIFTVLRPRWTELREETVAAGLAHMAELGILETTVESEKISLGRRELIRKAGLTAAAVLPILITSVLIPPAAAAASCAHLGQACNATHHCCSGGVLSVGCVGGVCVTL
jgi:hypothetical protein